MERFPCNWIKIEITEYRQMRYIRSRAYIPDSRDLEGVYLGVRIYGGGLIFGAIIAFQETGIKYNYCPLDICNETSKSNKYFKVINFRRGEDLRQISAQKLIPAKTFIKKTHEN